MSKKSISHREANVSGCAPYKDLYIYMIEGQISEGDEIALGGNFLGNWVEDDSAFLFFSEPSRDVVDTLLKSREDLAYIDEVYLPYEQWQGGILEPIEIGSLMIIPYWMEVEPAAGIKRIFLDPGVVFGTGLHPTTMDCLRALIYLRERQIRIIKVLDLGTGTGILSIVAGFLGADHVTAVDLNPLAVKTAERNVLLNHLEETITVIEGDALDFVDKSADLVIANIHNAVIKRLFRMKDFQDKNWYLISGLMRRQIRDLKTQVSEYGLEVVQEWDYEMTWYTLLLARA
jgi:ribosomal protein L11 methyltransferase